MRKEQESADRLRALREREIIDREAIEREAEAKRKEEDRRKRRGFDSNCFIYRMNEIAGGHAINFPLNRYCPNCHISDEKT